MAENMEKANAEIVRIIITGPESTGKTELATFLADFYHVQYVPEYARTYIEKLNRPYLYDDVLNIALKQVEMVKTGSSVSDSILFVDTYLIITKIWFVRVFSEYPAWIDTEIEKTADDYYLLCKPDIPWIEDGIRENGGIMREILFKDYENELKGANLNYSVIGGEGTERYDNAVREVSQFLKIHL